jgi:hypothetical protein
MDRQWMETLMLMLFITPGGNGWRREGTGANANATVTHGLVRKISQNLPREDKI